MKRTINENWIMAVLCLLVVFQAVVLVSSRPKSAPATQPVISQQALAKLSFVPAKATIKKNESVSIDVILTPKNAMKLDGADVILTFNPQILQVMQVSTPKLFSFVSEKKEKEKEGKIYVTFLEEKSGGLLIKGQVKLLNLTIKGKVAGTSEISVLVAEEGPSTVITESETSRKLPFDYENFKLTVD